MDIFSIEYLCCYCRWLSRNQTHKSLFPEKERWFLHQSQPPDAFLCKSSARIHIIVWWLSHHHLSHAHFPRDGILLHSKIEEKQCFKQKQYHLAPPWMLLLLKSLLSCRIFVFVHWYLGREKSLNYASADIQYHTFFQRRAVVGAYLLLLEVVSIMMSRDAVADFCWHNRKQDEMNCIIQNNISGSRHNTYFWRSRPHSKDTCGAADDGAGEWYVGVV